MVLYLMDSLMASMTGDSSGEEILFPRRISMPNLLQGTYKTEMKEEDFKGEEVTFLSDRSQCQEESILFPRRISMPNLHKRTYKTEMKEEDFKREEVTFLSDRSQCQEESILFPRRIRMPNLLQGAYDPAYLFTTKPEMKEDTKKIGINETCFKDRREFEEESVTSADEVSIHTGENIKKDEGDSHSLRAESMIGKAGGMLDIQNTGVSLEIPPGALRHDYFIQMRIIPHHYLDEPELSFASNSSVVVELLPDIVKLLKPATLTLPDCLVLKENCRRKAKVYSSHHKEGNQPQWEEERNTECDVTYDNCVMRLHNFCWKKVKIDGHKVKAMKIKLFAAKRSHDENEIFLDIGYYWDLPSCQEVLKLNQAIVLHKKPFVFYKKGQLPLKVLQKQLPHIWTYNEENSAKMIKFSTVRIEEGDFCTFLLKKGVSDETDGCACFFKAGQGSDLVDLMFSLKESSLSRTEAIIPSSGNATAGDTEGTAASDESLRDLSVDISKCWMEVGRNLQLTEGQLESLDKEGYVTLREKIYQMLLVWKRKGGSAATYDVLGDALQKAGRLDLKEYLLKNYQPA